MSISPRRAAPVPRVRLRFSSLPLLIGIAFLVTGCGGDNGVEPNQRPVAVLGPDFGVAVGATVPMDGTASHDPDNDPLTYTWSFSSRPPGSTATLNSTTAPTVSFLADVAGQYTVQLVVSDGDDSSAPAFCTVTANTVPVADAGPDQDVSIGDVVQLDGGQSFDADGDALTYQWSMASRPAGSAATLSNAAAVNPTFTADVEGDFVVQLTVSDGIATSGAASVTIHATSGPAPGYYSGTTSEGRSISFRVSADRSEVESGLKIRFTLSCTFCSGWAELTLNSSLAVTGGGFSYSSSRLDLAGNLTSETTFEGTARYVPLPPPGCGSCSTRNVTWTASWQSAMAPPAVADGREPALPPVGYETLRVQDGYCTQLEVWKKR